MNILLLLANLVTTPPSDQVEFRTYDEACVLVMMVYFEKQELPGFRRSLALCNAHPDRTMCEFVQDALKEASRSIPSELTCQGRD